MWGVGGGSYYWAVIGRWTLEGSDVGGSDMEFFFFFFIKRRLTNI